MRNYAFTHLICSSGMRADVRGQGERFWIFTRDVHRRCLQTKRTILEEIEAVITDDNIYEMPEILMSEM